MIRQVSKNVSAYVSKRLMCTSTAKPVDLYPKSIRVLHWAMGTGIIGAIGFVQAAMYTEDKELKGKLMHLHKSFGLLVGAAVIPRVGIRLMSTSIPKLPTGTLFEHMGATFTHYSMYGFMMFMPVSGIVMGYYGGRGVPFFKYSGIQGAPEEKRKPEVAKKAYKLHKKVGQIFEYGIIPLHITAVPYHHLIKGQKILSRMNPFA
eukprot:CAMPEP_0174261048 /NCGR_PEP_ID=MMETSP0439-20130205/11201_1 /TAXON_ID=0 /ORGANISM="Stereomyxa ramosa, Strain Chinc5" /LENGTH=203 /DNA_ID=CAMNT_0015345459 /DNA_START=37 /DNA_END=648 /DNA_ORIENTATION=+